MTENKCERCEGEGWIAATDKECRTCGGDGVTYEYDEPRYIEFVEDMRNAGIPVKHYNGRFYYRGPAVFTNVDEGLDRQDVYRATKVKCQEDTLGRYDNIVYPR